MMTCYGSELSALYQSSRLDQRKRNDFSPFEPLHLYFFLAPNGIEIIIWTQHEKKSIRLYTVYNWVYENKSDSLQMMFMEFANFGWIQGIRMHDKFLKKAEHSFCQFQKLNNLHLNKWLPLATMIFLCWTLKEKYACFKEELMLILLAFYWKNFFENCDLPSNQFRKLWHSLQFIFQRRVRRFLGLYDGVAG